MQLSPNFRLRKKFAVQNPQARRCSAPGCNRSFKNSSGLTQHENAHHPDYIPEPEVAAPSAPSAPVPLVHYSSEEEMIADEGWRDRWTPEGFTAEEQNENVGCQNHQAGASAGPQTSDEDEEDQDNNNQDNLASPSGSRRATVEDVEDEDDASSTSSSNSRSRTLKTYHPLLDGAFPFLLLYLMTQTHYS